MGHSGASSTNAALELPECSKRWASLRDPWYRGSMHWTIAPALLAEPGGGAAAPPADMAAGRRG